MKSDWRKPAFLFQSRQKYALRSAQQTTNMPVTTQMRHVDFQSSGVDAPPRPAKDGLLGV